MLKGRLIALVQEPDEGDKLNLGVMKELTGNDQHSITRTKREQSVYSEKKVSIASPC